MYYYPMYPPCMPCTYPPYPCPMPYDDREEDESKYDQDLKSMYPKMYFKLCPMVDAECEKLEKKHGEMYCPTKQDIDSICKETYKKLKSQLEEMDDDDDEKCGYRRRRYGRRRAVYDLTTILLLDRFRRRRRRRRRRKRRRRRRYY
ncbi:hypothetical protein [Clostridium oceanicum]|uniref:Uncharacterized protein n=1 Tax=Clostridium oceanicum TaxID=1543 RepID=A0ABP3UP43_9CLOT